MKGREGALRALAGEPIERVPRYADVRDPALIRHFGGGEGLEAKVRAAKALGLDMTREPARIPELTTFEAVETLGPAVCGDRVFEGYRACADLAGDDLLPLVEFPFSILGPVLAGRDSMEALATMASSPSRAASLLEKSCRTCVEIADRIASRGRMEAVIFMDDLAGSLGPLISPATLRALYFPRLREVIHAIKAFAPFVIFHSDGDLKSLRRDIVAAGAAGHHPVEPVGAWNLAEAAQDGSVAIGNGSMAMICATTRSAAAEGRRCLKFGADRGGYFMAPSAEIGPEVPAAHLLAFLTGEASPA